MWSIYFFLGSWRYFSYIGHKKNISGECLPRTYKSPHKEFFMKVSKFLAAAFLCAMPTVSMALTETPAGESFDQGEILNDAVPLMLEVTCRAEISAANSILESDGNETQLDLVQRQFADEGKVQFSGAPVFKIRSMCPYAVGMKQPAHLVESASRANKHSLQFHAKILKGTEQVDQNESASASSEGSLVVGATEQPATTSIGQEYTVAIASGSTATPQMIGRVSDGLAPHVGQYRSKVSIAIQAL